MPSVSAKQHRAMEAAAHGRSPAEIREDDRLDRIKRAVEGRLTPEELAEYEREKRGPRMTRADQNGRPVGPDEIATMMIPSQEAGGLLNTEAP